MWAEDGICDKQVLRGWLDWTVDSSTNQVDYLLKHYRCEDLHHLLSVVCNATILDGDHLEAASPKDPSFWVIHPTVERLWVWKKLSGSFRDETWPGAKSAACFNCYCYGHAAEDNLPFEIALLKPGGVKGYRATASFTNQQLYDLADPHEQHLPYIYDDLTWSHCAELGYDFSSI